MIFIGLIVCWSAGLPSERNIKVILNNGNNDYVGNDVDAIN